MISYPFLFFGCSLKYHVYNSDCLFNDITGTANLGWLARASEGTSAIELVSDYCGISRDRTGEPAIRISEKSKVHIPSYDAFPSK